MSTRPYSRHTAPDGRDTDARILRTAEELIREGAFHRATVTQLAARAGVGRATVFGRFDSKLGVLEALATRCSGSPELAALHAAFTLDDPVEAVRALVDATVMFWEKQGHILITLKAIVELEPGAVALIDAQHAEQAGLCRGLAQRLKRAGALRDGLTVPAAGPLLHVLTSVESFLELRRAAGLSLAATRAALHVAVGGLLRDAA